MYSAGDTVYAKFTSRASTGAPATLSGSPAVSVYKNNSTTQSTSGVALTVDFDAVTGLNHVSIDTSTDSGFYTNGAQFHVVITAGAVSGTSVVGEVVSEFQLEVTPLRPTVSGRTLDVSASGEAGIDWANVGSPTTTVVLSSTTIKTATDIETDTQDIQTRLPTSLTTSGHMRADMLAVSGDVTAADNLEAASDGTGYNLGNGQIIVASVTNAASVIDSRLMAIGLDHLVSAAVAGADVADDSIVAKLVSKSVTADFDSFVHTTDSLEAIRDKTGDVETDTQDIQARLPNALTPGGNLKADVVAISGDTVAADNLEAAADGVGYNLGAGQIVVASVTNASGVIDSRLAAIGLDHLVSAAVSGTDVADNSIIAKLASKNATADFDSYQNATDSLEAISDKTTAIQTTVGGITGSGGPVEQRPIADDFTITLTSRGSASLGTTPIYYQQASEKIAYAIDFAALLHDGDAISSIVSLTENTSQAITLTPLGVCGTQAKFFVEDVTVGSLYKIECKVLTLFGLTLEGDFTIAHAD